MAPEPNNAAAGPGTGDAAGAGAGRPVVALVADLIFASKISAVAQHVGVAALPARTPEQARTLLAGAAGLIVDLHLDTADAVEFIHAVKSDPSSPPVVAFASHVQKDLIQAAKQAGADTVLPRSKFTRELAQILRRLATPQG